MGSSDSEGSISSSLPIPKLIKRIKHSFLERDFIAVRNILKDRERGMKVEIESLSRERDSAREEASLLEGKVALGELERLKLEHKLVQIEKKCRDMENTVSCLREEKQLIVELNDKVDGLTKEKLESEKLARVYRDKCDCLETKAVEMKQAMDDLGHERLGAIGTIEDLRRKLAKTEKALDELKRPNVEAKRMVGEMMMKNLESEKEAEFHRRRLDSLVPRITKIEEYLAGMLNVNVEDLADIAGNGNLSHFFTREDFDHTVETCPSSRSRCNSPQVESNEREPPPRSGEGHSRKLASSPSATGDKLKITGISNSSNPNLAAPVSSGGIRKDLSENEMNCEEKFVKSPCSRDVLLEKSNKRARSALMGHKKTNEPSDTQFSLWIFNGSSGDEDSTDSDESCSDSRIDELVASLRHANSTEN
ncbi:heat shock transcription factor A4A [Striga asiatica]|uniref:Heat shock transcription factor A4A n=1 Tax=Striga asiatica TaxID=4170 RepID=A0A5A7P2A5_STRAF|nr:heat shock transcription factor A4A [Striga asiatica]